MFEDFTVLDAILTIFFAYILIRIFALANDPELLELRARLASLEQVECIVEEMNGQFYLWMKIPDEGCQFIGQDTNRERLAEVGRKFLLRKYGVSET